MTESFLTPIEEAKIVDAIKFAEKQTSCEIRVHVESYEQSETIEERAITLFNELEMHKTDAKNGVILYVAVNLKKFVIYGDEGIHNIVGDAFWNSTRDLIQSEFRQENFCEGMIKGILQIAEVMKGHFPWQEDDVNELSDEISTGDF